MSSRASKAAIDGPRRLALLMEVVPRQDATTAVLRISNVTTDNELTMQPLSLLLTLECDTGDRVARGHVQLPTERTSHVIQTDVTLFEALKSYIAAAETA